MSYKEKIITEHFTKGTDSTDPEDVAVSHTTEVQAGLTDLQGSGMTPDKITIVTTIITE
jgi:hypothetical protein